MFRSVKEIEDSVFTLKVKSALLNSLKMGLKAYNSFIDSNKEFFNHSSNANFFPLARTYAIERQFAIEAEKASSPFTFYKKELGLFKFKVGFVHLDGVVVSIAKTHKAGKLPSKSKYKIELSKSNEFSKKYKQMDMYDFCKQLDGLVQESQNNSEELLDTTVLSHPKYCIITYGIHEDSLAYARILMPNSDYRGYQLNIDLMEAVELVEKEEIQDEEENIATIKNELQNHYLKKGEGNG